ncbi:MAG: diguanylate cyclase [Actinobacteria bacterium]|nr:diguanylate cyclase [Actinomycetota bacterium]
MTVQVVVVNASISWAVCASVYRIFDITFPAGAARHIAYLAPLVLPAVVAPLTTVPRLRLSHKLHESNEHLRREVERREALQRDLQYQATHDALTAVLNRRGFIEQATTALQHGGVLVLVDVDKFKAVNDVHGHAAGDQVLQAIARILREVGASGLTGRLGGDEFVVLLPPGDLSAAERIQTCLSGVPLALPDGRTVEVSASVGIAPVAPDATLDTALATVDAGMYERKRVGREPLTADAHRDQQQHG